MTRVCELRDEDGPGGQGHGDAEADDHPAAEEGADAGADALQDDANDHDEAPNQDGRAPTPAVR